MTHYMCATCGTQFAATEQQPERCPICEDERQYIGWGGQHWTTLEELRQDHHTVIKDEEHGLTGIGTDPSFAIGQRALLVRTPGGNLLWDCISLLDEPTVTAVRALGGIAAIAISHPHYYSSMVEWARAFDAPIYLHAADKEWVMRPDPAIVFWDGETRDVGDGLTLIRCGGHFAGGTVLHWAAGADKARRHADRGHSPGGAGSALRKLHVLLPQPDPAPGNDGAAHRRYRRPLRLRPHLRRLVGSGRSGRRQGGGGAIRGSVHRGPQHRSIISTPALSSGLWTICSRRLFLRHFDSRSLL